MTLKDDVAQQGRLMPRTRSLGNYRLLSDEDRGPLVFYKFHVHLACASPYPTGLRRSGIRMGRGVRFRFSLPS